MNDCIFCKIIKGEIPSTKVYEDKNFLAFLDIHPVSFGHLLVIPKRHIVWMQDADDETISGTFNLSKKLMTSIKKVFKCDYVQISVGGTDVPHFHVHVFPRYLNDGLSHYPTKEYKDGEKETVSEKIKLGLV